MSIREVRSVRPCQLRVERLEDKRLLSDGFLLPSPGAETGPIPLTVIASSVGGDISSLGDGLRSVDTSGLVDASGVNDPSIADAAPTGDATPRGDGGAAPGDPSIIANTDPAAAPTTGGGTTISTAGNDSSTPDTATIDNAPTVVDGTGSGADTSGDPNTLAPQDEGNARAPLSGDTPNGSPPADITPAATDSDSTQNDGGVLSEPAVGTVVFVATPITANQAATATAGSVDFLPATGTILIGTPTGGAGTNGTTGAGTNSTTTAERVIGNLQGNGTGNDDSGDDNETSADPGSDSGDRPVANTDNGSLVVVASPPAMGSAHGGSDRNLGGWRRMRVTQDATSPTDEGGAAGMAPGATNPIGEVNSTGEVQQIGDPDRVSAWEFGAPNPQGSSLLERITAIDVASAERSIGQFLEQLSGTEGRLGDSPEAAGWVAQLVALTIAMATIELARRRLPHPAPGRDSDDDESEGSGWIPGADGPWPLGIS